jgi:hypothetical protein
LLRKPGARAHDEVEDVALVVAWFSDVDRGVEAKRVRIGWFVAVQGPVRSESITESQHFADTPLSTPPWSRQNVGASGYGPGMGGPPRFGRSARLIVGAKLIRYDPERGAG